MAKLLKAGDRGAEVVQLQENLIYLGFDVGSFGADGRFGPTTLQALKAFQRKALLECTGIYDVHTQTAMRSILQLVPQPIPQKLVRYSHLWFEDAYHKMTFDPGFEKIRKTAVARMVKNQATYLNCERITGVPWYAIGAINNLEQSGSLLGVLHNGEKILGTGRKTTLVPKGLGPFETFEEAALDVMNRQGWTKATDWRLGPLLERMERYNGLGYRKRNPVEFSPYLWATTSQNDGRGRYVRDGVFDANANSNSQVGAAAVLKEAEIQGLIEIPRMSYRIG